MSKSVGLPDLTVQDADISARINSTVLGIFMTGMYTIVYFGTLYIRLNEKVSRPHDSRKKVVIWAITFLYIFCIIECSFNWAFLLYFFVKNGETKTTIFISLLETPRWIHVMNNLFAFGMLIIADGLMIWRCFNAWGCSWFVILFPLFLYVADICIFGSALIILFVAKAQPTPSQAILVNNLDSAGFFISTATSLTATFLIAYRIYSLSKNSLTETWGRFKHIAEIFVQSVAVYTMALLFQALSDVIPFRLTDSRSFSVEVYAASILIPITGIAPTVMVARVSLAASNESDMWMTANARKTESLRFDHTAASSNIEENPRNLNIRVIGESDIEKSSDAN